MVLREYIDRVITIKDESINVTPIYQDFAYNSFINSVTNNFNTLVFSLDDKLMIQPWFMSHFYLIVPLKVPSSCLIIKLFRNSFL